MIRDQRRHADAEVYVESVAQFASDALHDAVAFIEVFGRFRHGYSSLVVRRWASGPSATTSMPLAQWLGQRRKTNDQRPVLPSFSQFSSRTLRLEKSASHKCPAYARDRDQFPRLRPGA